MSNKKPGKRIGKRLSRAKSALMERNPPADHIIAKRALFGFVESKGGEIDQDICDGIGQLHALGLLEGHGVDPQEMRDRARTYAELYWNRYQATAPKTGKYERADKSTSHYDGETGRDRLFARMDEALQGYDRAVFFDLVVDRTWGDVVTPWAQGLIDEQLLKRGRVKPLMRFPTMDDRARLDAAIRACCAIIDGAIPARWQRAA